MEEAAAHLHLAASTLHSVAIVGPANAGKSTLYNQLVRAREPRAAVSAIPGTTRQAQAADAGIFTVVDTPGADLEGPTGLAQKEQAMDAARAADLLIVIFDGAHGIRPGERRLLADLMALQKPFVIALNKMDLVGSERTDVLGKAAAALGVPVEQLLPVSAKSGAGVERPVALHRQGGAGNPGGPGGGPPRLSTGLRTRPRSGGPPRRPPPSP